ncbi:hypothetical protein JNW88_00160 [Micromonospora sp. ATA32]|nr:hypothetical protein [Micromonospora sp. ATA32]
MSRARSTADVDLVAAVVTRHVTRRRGDETSPYSWGTAPLVAPGHARDTAAAVLGALARSGRLVTAGRLAEWGRAGWAWGWPVGALFAMCAERVTGRGG